MKAKYYWEQVKGNGCWESVSRGQYHETAADAMKDCPNPETGVYRLMAESRVGVSCILHPREWCALHKLDYAAAQSGTVLPA